MCSFQFNLQIKPSPRHFTTSVCGLTVWLVLTAGQCPLRRVNFMRDDLDSLTLIFYSSAIFRLCVSVSAVSAVTALED
jgi:hypothetical protein